MKSLVKILTVLIVFLLVLSISAFGQTTCGNGLCDPGENQCTCQKDCGECSGDVIGAVCKQRACQENLCKVINKTNCCGNGSCESGELFSNCPADCAPKQLKANILYPKEGDYFTKGESILIRAEVLVDGQKTNFANITVEGVFGEGELLNDGKHGDGTNFDYIFGNVFKLPKDINDGSYPFTLSAEFRGLKANTEGTTELKSKLDFEGTQFPTETFQGTQLNISGKTLAKKAPAKSSIEFSLKSGETTILQRSLETDSNGNFSIVYPISFIDPLGTWTYQLKAQDSNGNAGLIEGKIEVKAFESQQFEISLPSDLRTEYKRGETIDLVVSVNGEDGKSIGGARVELSGPNGLRQDFFEFAQAKYSSSVVFGDNFPEGTARFRIKAVVSRENKVIEVAKEFSILAKSGEIGLEIVSPKENSFGAGETIPIRVKVLSPNQKKLVNAKVTATINGSEIALSPVEYGVFGANYIVKEEDVGQASLFVKAVDESGNFGATSTGLDFLAAGLAYFVNKNLVMIAIAVLVVIVLLPVSARVLSKRLRLETLRKREERLNSLIGRLQNRYYNEKSLKKEEYKKEFDSLTFELLHARSELSKLEKK